MRRYVFSFIHQKIARIVLELRRRMSPMIKRKKRKRRHQHLHITPSLRPGTGADNQVGKFSDTSSTLQLYLLIVLLSCSSSCFFFFFLQLSIPSGVINTLLTPDGFTTPKCWLDTIIHTVSTHSQPLCLFVPCLSGSADVRMFLKPVSCVWLSGYFYPAERSPGTHYSVAQAECVYCRNWVGQCFWLQEISVGSGCCSVTVGSARSYTTLLLLLITAGSHTALRLQWVQLLLHERALCYWCLKFQQRTSCFPTVWSDFNVPASAVGARTSATTLNLFNELICPLCSMKDVWPTFEFSVF